MPRPSKAKGETELKFLKMNLRRKLLACFSMTALFMIIVGIISIWSSHNFIQEIEFEHQHFRSIINTATRINACAKKAESRLLFFLIFKDPKEYEEYLSCLNDINSQIRKLQGRIKDKDGEIIVSKIAEEAGRLSSRGEILKKIFDQAAALEKEFRLSDHSLPIRAFHESASTLRRDGVQLTRLMTQFLNRQTSITSAVEISSYAKRAETLLLLFLSLHRDADRRKFFARVKSLNEHIQNLTADRDHFIARNIIDQMKIKSEELELAGENILALYDEQVSLGGPFRVSRFQTEFLRVHDAARWLRDAGVKVEKMNVDLETQRRADLIQKAWLFKYISLFVVIFGFIISILLSLVFSRKMTDQIHRLKSAAEQIGKGNFDIPIEIGSKDEIGDLAGFIKEMSGRLKSLTEKLSMQNQSLIREIEAHKISNDRLKLALEEVRQLSGLLPICASCKKVRDDKGYWSQIDAYIQEHTQAKFSHSMCPECSEKLYGEEDWYIEMKDKKKKE